MLEQLEKGLLRLLLPFQKLPVQERGLLGESLKSHQVGLRIFQGARQNIAAGLGGGARIGRIRRFDRARVDKASRGRLTVGVV